MELVEEASSHSESPVRTAAVDACLGLRTERVKSLLRGVALWDQDLMVRKAASITLTDWLGEGAQEVLTDDGTGERVGPLRRAISLAMIRDYERRLVRLSGLSIPAALLVVLGLMWLRLRRGRAEMLRAGVGGPR